MAHQNQGDSQFTVFIRLPFPRGDFVDPPPVEWNAAKDQALWDILSRPSKGDDIDWKALADNFDVTLQFLLQQAAWLYDRQLSQVRAQMRKVPVDTSHSNSPSPAPGSVSGSTALGGQPTKGTPSTAPRAPSRLALHQQDAYPQRTPGSRRASSSTTVNQVRGSRAPSRNETPTAEAKEPRLDTYGRRPSMNRREQPPSHLRHRSPTLEEEEDLSSSPDESDSDGEVDSRKTPRFKRFGKFSTQRPGLIDDEDDGDDSPAFLPLSREPEDQRDSHRQDLNATLRLDSEHPATQRRRVSDHQPTSRNPVTSESSTSSVSSGIPVNMPESEERRRKSHLPGGLSPRAAELARASPRRSTASGKSTDDTPSMGSSFSDLDDASVTQSALEEALMSNMQHGGMASRMSTISQALRSRYL